MANFTNFLENKLLDALTGVAPYTFPSNVYIALFTTDPTDAGIVTGEVSVSEYERKSLSGHFSTAVGTSGSSSNTSIISWITPTVPWGIVTHIGFMIGGTKGVSDMLLWAEPYSAQEIDSSYTMLINISDLTLIIS